MNYDLTSMWEKAIGARARNKLLHEQRDQKQSELNSLRQRAEALEELQVVVQQAAQRTQDKIKSRFETIVQSCIDVVFPSQYKFHFDFVPKRGKVECDIYLTNDTGNRMEPMSSNGGGLVDVISISLRVACLTLGTYDKVLLLDEPFSHLRGAARAKLGEVLECLSNKIGLQIIMVGDVGGSSVKADREFSVTKNGGVSKVDTVDTSDR